MGIRERSGNWHYRIKVHGHEYSGDTDLAATERNRSAAMRIEAAARKTILDGRAAELNLRIKPFSEAAGMFLDWADGEHRAHPATARRLRTSFASLLTFFHGKAVSQITPGDVEAYKTYRRGQDIKEITLRHDLHALSKFFGYAAKHNWCRSNPVTGVEIPSDDAQRIHVITEAEEVAYFAEAVKYSNLYDAARLILLQGVRPEEVMRARKQDVQGDHWLIPRGKSKAATRRLRLTAEAKGILTARCMAAGLSGWLFEGRTKGTHQVTFQRSHDAVLEATGLSFVLYDFRHTFATRAAAAGVPITSLAAILGHGNLRSVMRYVHTRQQDIDAAMVLLEPKAAKEEKARVM